MAKRNERIEREILRVIDANFNRSREGLRVCEDIARFAFDSPNLTAELKGVRHKISDILKNFKALSEYRNVKEDVGRKFEPDKITKRSGVIDIFSANIERVKESLRVLEEFFKLVDKRISTKFSILRYEVYDIEKKFIKKASSLRNP